ncbi:hypothetical protein CSUI_007148, partial [Cystoisospora suis]
RVPQDTSVHWKVNDIAAGCIHGTPASEWEPFFMPETEVTNLRGSISVQ